jgi:hypothetical protein
VEKDKLGERDSVTEVGGGFMPTVQEGQVHMLPRALSISKHLYATMLSVYFLLILALTLGQGNANNSQDSLAPRLNNGLALTPPMG